MSKTVAFTYTHAVYDPVYKAGAVGETKQLPLDIAAELQSQGYGHIGDKTDGTGDSEVTDSGRDLSGGDEDEKSPVRHRRRRKSVDT